MVARRAHVVVVAGPIQGQVNAAGGLVAGVPGTRVAVIAVHCGTRLAATRAAKVRVGARVVVTALPLRIGVEAAHVRVATVIRAFVSILAVERLSARAGPGLARLARSACVGIVAGEAVVCRQILAFAGQSLAFALEAGPVLTRSGRTFNDSIRVNRTLEGDPTLVTVESAVAEIAIFICFAVFVGLAVAGNERSLADPFNAHVSNGARVAVVAEVEVELKDASGQSVARIIGAGVPVITCNGSTCARALFAVISHGTDIPIVAVGARERLVDASVRAVA